MRKAAPNAWITCFSKHMKSRICGGLRIGASSTWVPAPYTPLPGGFLTSPLASCHASGPASISASIDPKCAAPPDACARSSTAPSGSCAPSVGGPPDASLNVTSRIESAFRFREKKRPRPAIRAGALSCQAQNLTVPWIATDWPGSTKRQALKAPKVRPASGVSLP